jgi:hypothetical protein
MSVFACKQSLPQLRRQSNTITDSSRALGQTTALLQTATLRRELPGKRQRDGRSAGQ